MRKVTRQQHRVYDFHGTFQLGILGVTPNCLRVVSDILVAQCREETRPDYTQRKTQVLYLPCLVGVRTHSRPYLSFLLEKRRCRAIRVFSRDFARLAEYPHVCYCDISTGLYALFDVASVD